MAKVSYYSQQLSWVLFLENSQITHTHVYITYYYYYHYRHYQMVVVFKLFTKVHIISKRDNTIICIL